MRSALEVEPRPQRVRHLGRGTALAVFGAALAVPMAASGADAAVTCACGGDDPSASSNDTTSADAQEQRATPEPAPAAAPQPAPPAARAPDAAPAPEAAPTPEPTPITEPAPEAAPAPAPAAEEPKPGEHEALASPEPEPAPEPDPAPEPEPAPPPAAEDPKSGEHQTLASPESEPDPATEPEPATEEPGEHEALASSDPAAESPEPPARQALASTEGAPAPALSPSGGEDVKPPEHQALSPGAELQGPAELPAVGPLGLVPAPLAGGGAGASAMGQPEPPALPGSHTGMSGDAAERSAQREPPEPEPPAVTGRVTSWNIGRGAPGTQGADWDQLDEVADVIAAGNSDVVVLQEVFVSDVETIVDHLEDEHGLTYHAEHVEADEKPLNLRDRSDNFWDEFWHVTVPVPEAFGQATLSLEPISSTTRHELPDDGDEARVVMEAQTTINGAPVRVFDTHLSTHDEGRDEQIPAAFDAAGGSDVPAVFAGDFNTGPSDVTPTAEQRGFEQAEPAEPTSCGSGDTPRSDLDHIYVRGAEASRPTVGECAPSDHAPVGVEVTLPAGSSASSGGGGGGGGGGGW